MDFNGAFDAKPSSYDPLANSENKVQRGSIDDFFGDGISLTQYSDKPEASSTGDLINLGQPSSGSGGPQAITGLDVFDDALGQRIQLDQSQAPLTATSSYIGSGHEDPLNTMDDESIGLRTYSSGESQVLISNAKPKTQPAAKQAPINLVRNTNNSSTSGGFLPGDSSLWRCLSCINLGSYQKYFDVTTVQVKERLYFAMVGHFTGMQRPGLPDNSTSASSADSGMMDFDLYVPTWMMITLIVECSIVGYMNHHIYLLMHEGSTLKVTKTTHSVTISDDSFSVSTLSHLFTFMVFFFTIAPLGVYLFARLKLLDGQTRFFKLFSALGYSYVSYIPAIMLTVVDVSLFKWLVIALALGNQMICLYKQADELIPKSKGPQSAQTSAEEVTDEDFDQLLRILKVSLLVSQILFALCLKVFFVH